MTFSRPGAVVRPALVNGCTGAVVTVNAEPVSVMSFAISNSRIVEIQSLVDPERLVRLDLSVLEAGRTQGAAAQPDLDCR